MNELETGWLSARMRACNRDSRCRCRANEQMCPPTVKRSQKCEEKSVHALIDDIFHACMAE